MKSHSTVTAVLKTIQTPFTFCTTHCDVDLITILHSVTHNDIDEFANFLQIY